MLYSRVRGGELYNILGRMATEKVSLNKDLKEVRSEPCNYLGEGNR